MTLSIGERVSWNFGIDTATVHGEITDLDVDGRRAEVKWADGSGPTWADSSLLLPLGVAA